MKITQLTNENGRPVANHFVLYDEETGARILQSYDSKIVKIEKGVVTLGGDWKYSVTTSKYRSRFLGETTKETQAKLDAGIYLYDEDMK